MSKFVRRKQRTKWGSLGEITLGFMSGVLATLGALGLAILFLRLLG